mmetsp:Transcript_23291/g.55240  ORF Transcript_23291/g.55240 Transcript_23291/m.55240 type:complete len:87 (+) Transcript_23291:1-261(+)
MTPTAQTSEAGPMLCVAHCSGDMKAGVPARLSSWTIQLGESKLDEFGSPDRPVDVDDVGRLHIQVEDLPTPCSSDEGCNKEAFRLL